MNEYVKIDDNNINSFIDKIKTNIKEFVGDKTVVIGISGGKDSTVAAKLLVDALGKDKVLGVLMPEYVQADIQDSYDIVKLLDIPFLTVDIGSSVSSIENTVAYGMKGVSDPKGVKLDSACSEQARTNLPPRIRMTTLYYIAQNVIGGAFVVNTCNYSESYIGWETKFGDGAGDFSVLGRIRCTDVIKIGLKLGLPDRLINKAPSDGLCGETDEDKFGFTYEQLDTYLSGIESALITEDVKGKIEKMHEVSEHKRNPIWCAI